MNDAAQAAISEVMASLNLVGDVDTAAEYVNAADECHEVGVGVFQRALDGPHTD